MHAGVGFIITTMMCLYFAYKLNTQWTVLYIY